VRVNSGCGVQGPCLGDWRYAQGHIPEDEERREFFLDGLKAAWPFNGEKLIFSAGQARGVWSRIPGVIETPIL
jgi:hypothetical protein